MKLQAWKKIKEEQVYQGYRNIIRRTFELPHQKVVDFDIIDVPSFVCIAAITSQQEILLVEQYRPGPEKTMVSFPEGRIDPGEEPEAAVYRELLEETGYQTQAITLLKTIPHAYSNQQKYCYLAYHCELVQEQNLDEHEFIQVKLLSIAAFKQFLKNPLLDNFNSVDAGYLLLDHLGYL